MKKKNLAIAIISLLSFSMYSQNRYELQDEGAEKLYLSDTIISLAKNKTITNQPIVVIDGKPYRFQDLEKEKIQLHKDEIKKIVPLERQIGINIYGNFAEAGVLIITTNKQTK
ncbi:hypothetical protein B0A75_06025 [Flavobacterium oncorhynchi]|uniref:TonB-dependent receptor plug domain-containing protein n=1 Tax=Flavobacterium oncorhynchi TaxID=728056 RepID=A0A226I4I2_9FLAO|nr:hypothetical protein [Flavobacterium oncorhynchi]OXB01123.1 hypothetical protein B0A75_06025 [Flavobacterium oncorhynchi]